MPSLLMQCGGRVDGRCVRWHVVQFDEYQPAIPWTMFFLSLRTSDNTNPLVSNIIVQTCVLLFRDLLGREP